MAYLRKWLIHMDFFSTLHVKCVKLHDLNLKIRVSLGVDRVDQARLAMKLYTIT